MYRPADILTISFSSFLFILTAFFFHRIPQAGYLLLIYSSLIFFQVILVRLSRMNAFLAHVRDIVFPVVSVLIIFDSLGPLVHRINPQDMDYFLIRLDYAIFGCYPTVLMEKITFPALTDVLQIAYSSYYFLPISLGVVLKRKGKEEAFEKALFLILLCFYLSYVGYLLVPAIGPRYTMDHLQTGPLEGLLVAKPIQDTLNLLEGVKRDAFPSGHTGIALTVLFLAYRYERLLFRWMLVPVLLLVLATVYCRYHYAIDVVAGVMLTVVTIGSGEVYYRFWLKRRKGSSTPS